MSLTKIKYQTVKLEGYNVFYREAGSKDAPTILLLHGYPTSSHMYRNLINRLSDQNHVIAPDLIGYGFSDAPHYKSFDYTFDNLTRYVQALIDHLDLKRFAIQVFDYGAPVGYRLAAANPRKITGIISQNGNAYEEGLSDGWAIVKKYWADPSEENRNNLRSPSNAAAIQWQYFTGAEDKTLVAPEAYTLDQIFMDRPDNEEAQLDLFKDYASNVELYPSFQEYFRTFQPPLLAVWGENDPYFIPAGANAFKRDLPDAIIKFFNAGHFALETKMDEICLEIVKFLKTLPK
ncbi:alpha/beta fold hydrolase [Mucilaginibacter sp. E4BP6]|uniref:alpha/beta fold hydrolase n=1 Tax=Mucilaginibacter sp. E4BP6 TaxID=2723089 RepID=UPI0015CE2BBC|nr:alpha/beta fold hydrolase [Mucilaginibacter sp. E4BP6]NYE67036.1 pimeloyl-ACP methyl ester carboxylesterase [Mucilaginibacter sp. E4BP6]